MTGWMQQTQQVKLFANPVFLHPAELTRLHIGPVDNRRTYHSVCHHLVYGESNTQLGNSVLPVRTPADPDLAEQKPQPNIFPEHMAGQVIIRQVRPGQLARSGKLPFGIHRNPHHSDQRISQGPI